MSILTTQDVHAGYGDIRVLEGVDIEVNEGEIVCLIGPNGAGKSTVFRCIYGLIRPWQGDIRFQDRSITAATQRELIDAGISYFMQRDSVFPDMTVRENLEMGAYTASDEVDIDARIGEMSEMFPILEARAGTKAKALSGGERQMLEFARGMMLDPELLLIDEPTAGLAPKIIGEVFDVIERINGEGVTILMIEQNVKTALQYADRAYVLENGRTKFQGEAATILDEPEIREAYLGGSQDG
jgi:ABC-type branched-subunit amino acid transport system ATPase component